MKGISFLVGGFLVACNATFADTIVQWTFNSVPPDSATGTGTLSPAVGQGSAALIGGTTATFATGSTNDPASSADDSGWNTSDYPPQASNNKSAGVQFNASTLGYSNIVVRWDQRTTGTASRYFRLQYTRDGSSFIDYPAATVALIAAPSASYYEAQTNSLVGFPGVDNNPDFAFRIVAEFQFTATGSGTNAYVPLGNSYGPSSGTVRFDYVTVSGTPIPGLNTPPNITSITNQTLRVNQTSAPIPFTVGDAEDDPASLTLAATSSDDNSVPGGNLVFGGAGSDRNVTITAGNQPGSANVTVYVLDSGGRSNNTSFVVTVLPLNTPPYITLLQPTNALVNTPVEIPFMVGDAETVADNVQVSGVSSNVTLVPTANLVFSGFGSNRVVTITPAPGELGVVPVALTASDGTNTSSSVFPLVVVPSTDVLLYEPFSYPDGSVITNSGFLWGNRSGVFGQCQTTNGELQITSAKTEDVVSPLIGGPYVRSNSTVLYSSFKVTLLSLPKIVPGLFASFANGSTLRGRVYIGTTNAAPGAFRFLVANGSDTNTPLTNDLATNVYYSVVTRYNVDDAATTLWLDPSAETDPHVTATDPQTSSTIASYGFRQDTDIGTTLLIDDLKVGLSFAAVITTRTNLPTPIPLNFQLLNDRLVLTWSNPAFTLQSAPDVSGAFADIQTATSPYTNVVLGSERYFRLKAN